MSFGEGNLRTAVAELLAENAELKAFARDLFETHDCGGGREFCCHCVFADEGECSIEERAKMLGVAI